MVADSMKPTKIRAILFDMDGTLIDSEEIYIRQLNSILKQFNKGPLTQSVQLKIQGRPGKKICEIIVHECGLEGQITGDQFYELTNHPTQLQLFNQCAFLPGIQDFLIKMKKEFEIPIAIATSTTRLKYTAKTSHLGENGFELFDIILTGGDHPRLPKERGKPHPDIWHLALEEINTKLNLQVNMKECLVLEDSISGIKSAINSGAHCIWIPCNKNIIGLLSQDELSYFTKNCDQILESFLEFDSTMYEW